MSAAPSPAETLPASWYHDPAQWAREREAIFGREWLLFAHESELARPGDAWAECVAGWPLIVVRDREGGLRGFHNVCRHRAGPLAFDGASHGAILRCRYHGWSYELDGRLREAPDFGDDAGLDPARLSLHPVRAASWRGFVFVNLDAAAPPLESALAPFAELACDVPLEAAVFHGRASHVLRCNWKTYVENYLEGYHIPWIHPALQREIVFKEYRVEVGEGWVRHRVPSRPRVAESVYAGFWAWLAPNVAFNVYASGMSVERMLPLGPDRVRLEYLFFFRDLSAAAAPEREGALAMCRRVTEEDRVICEAVQRNLEAGVYGTGRLSPRHEAGVRAFQERVRRALGG